MSKMKMFESEKAPHKYPHKYRISYTQTTPILRKPRHPQQKYLLTVKGLALYHELKPQED